MLCSPSHSWEGDGTVRDSVHSWSSLERGKCKSHCECLGPGLGFVIERERLKITAQAVSTTQDDKCFPLLHLMALRIVSQRDRRLHIGQDNGVEDPYSSQAKCSSITANDCDFHIGWHWVCGVCDWGMCVLDGLCTGVSSKALCGTDSGIVTELFSTSEKAYLLKTWISGKHIDLLRPSAVTPEGSNSEFTPIFSNPLFHWLPAGSTDMDVVFLSVEVFCLPLISV